MTQKTKTWTKPELNRLGKIDEVALSTSALCQKANNGNGNCITSS